MSRSADRIAASALTITDAEDEAAAEAETTEEKERDVRARRFSSGPHVSSTLCDAVVHTDPSRCDRVIDSKVRPMTSCVQEKRRSGAARSECEADLHRPRTSKCGSFHSSTTHSHSHSSSAAAASAVPCGPCCEECVCLRELAQEATTRASNDTSWDSLSLSLSLSAGFVSEHDGVSGGVCSCGACDRVYGASAAAAGSYYHRRPSRHVLFRLLSYPSREVERLMRRCRARARRVMRRIVRTIRRGRPVLSGETSSEEGKGVEIGSEESGGVAEGVDTENGNCLHNDDNNGSACNGSGAMDKGQRDARPARDTSSASRTASSAEISAEVGNAMHVPSDFVVTPRSSLSSAHASPSRCSPVSAAFLRAVSPHSPRRPSLSNESPPDAMMASGVAAKITLPRTSIALTACTTNDESCAGRYGTLKRLLHLTR